MENAGITASPSGRHKVWLPLGSARILSATVMRTHVGILLAGALAIGAALLGAEPTGAESEPSGIGALTVNPNDVGIGQAIPNFKAKSVDGKSIQLSSALGEEGAVIAMTSTTCPVSKKYVQTLTRLVRDLAPKGLNVIFINPTSSEPSADVRAAATALGGVYIHNEALAQEIGARSTSEVILIDKARTVIYRGAIDDQYGIGYNQSKPQNEYLNEAVTSFLRGRVPDVPATSAPGCLLDAPTNPRLVSVTYSNQVARIMNRHCVTCHHSGGIGPFRLDNFQDVKSRAPMIKFVVDSKRMPPWFVAEPPAGAASPWKHERILSAQEKRDLATWIEGDRREGDKAELPLPLTFVDDWTLGKPDMTLQIPKPIKVQAEGFMDYQHVVVPVGLSENRWIDAVEIVPTDRRVVHHVLVFEVPEARMKDPKFLRNPNPSLQDVMGFFAGYAPGSNWGIFPAGFAKRLRKGSGLLFQIHYTPNGTATQDQVKLGLHFAEGVPKHEMRVQGVFNFRIQIPPGAADHVETAKFNVPVDVKITAFIPHMHLRGKSFQYTVRYPDGTSKVVCEVPRYDFNWQLKYELRDPVLVPKGSIIECRAVYDNSAGNPANPDPTQTVYWGDQSVEEMMLGYVEYYRVDP